MITLLLFITSIFVGVQNGRGGIPSSQKNINNHLVLNQGLDNHTVLRIPKFLVNYPTNRPFDPYHGEALATDLFFYSLIYSPLISYDFNRRTYSPALITDWYSSLNATIWHFTLRKGVTFHDGSIFDTSVVKLNFDYIYHLNAIGELGQFGSDILDDLKSIKILSQYEFTATLNSPNGDFLGSFTSKFMLSPAALSSLTFVEPLGSGPYIYNLKQSNNEIEILDRFTSYYEGDPPFKRIELYNAIGQEQVDMFENGDLDVLNDWFGEFDDENIITHKINSEIVEQDGVFNFNKPIFSNKTVRLALNLAIDRSRINARQAELWNLDANDEFINTPYALYSDLMPYTPDSVFPYSYNPTLAEQLLDDAGYPRQANNSRFTLNIVTRSDGEYSSYVDLIADFLDEIGVTVVVDTFDLGGWIGRIIDRNFDILIITASGGTAPSGYGYSEFFSSFGSLHFGDYINQTLDQLFFEVRNTPVGNEQEIYYRQIFNVIVEDAPHLFLDGWGSFWHTNKLVDGLVSYTPGLQYEFTYGESTSKRVQTTSVSSNLDRIYMPKQELTIIGNEGEISLTVSKSALGQSLIEDITIVGNLVSTYKIDFLSQENSNFFRLYFRTSDNISLNNLTLYEIKEGNSAKKGFISNSTTNYIQFELSESSQLAIGQGDLKFQFVKLEIPTFVSFIIVFSIFAIGSVILVFDQRKRAEIRGEATITNFRRYLLFIPNTTRIIGSIILGMVISIFFSFGNKIFPIWFSSTRRKDQNLDEEEYPENRPKVYVNEVLVETPDHPILELKGKSIDLYYYLLRNPGYHGVRDIQRQLNYSTASLAHYHLTRLIQANAITKSDDGKYGIPEIDERIKLTVNDFANISKIVPRTFLAGITLLTIAFSLVITAVFVTSTLIWVQFVSPICFILALWQFRSGLSLVWNLQAQSIQSNDISKSILTFSDIQNMVTRAISLKQSGRVKDIFEAQNLLEKVLASDKISNELAIIALFNLCDIMVDELKIKEEVEIFQQAENLSQQIVTLANEMESNTLTVEALLIQSKFNLIKGDYEKSIENLQDAEYFSSEDEKLQFRVKEELTKIRSEVEKFRGLGSDPGLLEKLERVKIKDYLDDAIKMLDIKNAE